MMEKNVGKGTFCFVPRERCLFGRVTAGTMI